MSFHLHQNVKFLDQEGTATIKELRVHSAIVEDEFGFEEEILLKNLIPTDATFSVEKVILKDKPNSIPKKTTIEKERIVDLHFTQLVDFVTGFTPYQMLQKQLAEANKAIEQAKSDKVEKLILIHGKGTGKLEAELYKLLQKQTQIDYYDADFNRYKLGAVEIKFHTK